MGAETPRPEVMLGRSSAQRSCPLAGMRVLLVEDDRDLRALFAIMLTAEGAEAVQVDSGCDAMAAVRRHSFDAVVTDLGLPDLRGDLLIPHLRAIASEPLAVLVISGYGEPYLTMALTAGADAAFTKPVDWARIFACLLRVKRRRSA
jgi:DNA-binding response OmpR family regulator